MNGNRVAVRIIVAAGAIGVVCFLGLPIASAVLIDLEVAPEVGRQLREIHYIPLAIFALGCGGLILLRLTGIFGPLSQQQRDDLSKSFNQPLDTTGIAIAGAVAAAMLVITAICVPLLELRRPIEMLVDDVAPIVISIVAMTIFYVRVRRRMKATTSA